MHGNEAVIPGVQTVMVDRIRLDEKLQLRFAMDLDRVEDFAEAMRIGAVFPPVVVFWDGTDLWLGDGYHRVSAARRADLALIEADIREGTWRDALAFAFFANATHGEPLRPKERKAALPRIVEQFPDESTRDLGVRLGISHARVGQIRQRMGEGVKYLTPGYVDSVDDRSWAGAAGDIEPNPEVTRWAEAVGVKVEADQQARTDSVQAVIDAAGDDDGAWERARKIAYYSNHVASATKLLVLNPAEVADLLDDGRQISARSFCKAMQAWSAALLAAMDRPIHLVKRG